MNGVWRWRRDRFRRSLFSFLVLFACPAWQQNKRSNRTLWVYHFLSWRSCSFSFNCHCFFSCFCWLFFFIARHWETNLGSCKIQNKRVSIESRRLTPTGISIQSDWEVVAGEIMLLKVNKLDNKSNWAESLLHISFVSHKLSPNEITDFGFVVPKSPHDAQVLFASRSRALLLYEALLTK